MVTRPLVRAFCQWPLVMTYGNTVDANELDKFERERTTTRSAQVLIIY